MGKNPKKVLIRCDYSQEVGKIKPMNGVNNGPVPPSTRGMRNFELYKAANIPFARLHDASFYPAYGGEFTVDVHRIFRNFDADETKEESYDFEETDRYLKAIYESGTKIFYRLGASIEHYKKYGTYPPKDFLKWAKICEHIIRHYNQKWANGFEYGIEYWEIWNEPDCTNADGSHPCWQGTDEQFAEFFSTAAKYLKGAFPKLKFGGPAFAWLWDQRNIDILKEIHEKGTPLDFVSYHLYAREVPWFVSQVREANKIFKECGYGNAETYLNEWNYVKGWQNESWIYTIEAEQGIKGAAYTAAVMCACQKEKLDGLMYYDARPGCSMNGMFDDLLRPRKTYYAIKAFGELWRAGGEVKSEIDGEDIYACAAAGKNENGEEEKLALISYFTDDDTKAAQDVELDFSCLTAGKTKGGIYLLDGENDMKKIAEEDFSHPVRLTLKPQDVVLIKIA